MHPRALCFASVLWLASAALAADGRVELSQSSIAAAGGFPFRILSSGSYVLTSDLTVLPAATAIQIGANDVTLDLNGFAIRGPHVCGSGGCSAGSTIGIQALPLVSELARDTTVRNGVVAGFGGNCLDLGAGAHVEGLIVKRCGGSGIRVAEHALVTGNRVSDCGAWGLSFLAAASYRGNMLAGVNRLGGAGFIAGGSSSGGNVCDVGRCLRERRRYYQTDLVYAGDHGANDCAAGFHMASIYEVHDPSSLDYDGALGYVTSDSGSGPPRERAGWVRSGSPGGGTQYHCALSPVPWSSSFSGYSGLTARLHAGDFATDPVHAGNPRWITAQQGCNLVAAVWCVED